MASGALFAEKLACPVEDDAAEIAHLYEAFQRNWGVPEPYVQGKAVFRFDLWIRTGDRDGRVKRHIAVFQRAPGVDLHFVGRRPDIDDFDKVEGKEFRVAMQGKETRDQGPVFVFVRQPSESGQGVGGWVAVESLVWLAELDEVESGVADPLDIPIPSLTLSVARVLRRFLVENWKGVSEGRPLPVGDYKLSHDVIQDAAEIVESVPNHNAPLKWRLVSDLNAADIARGLLVYLGDDPVGVGVFLEEGVYEGLERMKMELCPL